jgi:hypothetical protein
MRENASFSIWGYLPSAPWSALLTKYTGFCTPSYSWIKAALIAVGVTAKYKYRTSPGIVRLSKGELVRYAFKLEKASSHSSIHSKAFLRILKKGRHLSVEREMNLFNAVSHPVSCCSCFVVFGDYILRTARIFLGLASIPLLETIYPRNFPEDTPKVHFAGFDFIPYCFSVAKAS